MRRVHIWKELRRCNQCFTESVGKQTITLHQLSASALLKAGTCVGPEPITESGQFRTQQIALTPFLRMSAQFPHPNPPGTKKKKKS